MASRNAETCHRDWITTFRKQLYSPSRLRRPAALPERASADADAAAASPASNGDGGRPLV
jgi:hypothetical protein